MRMKISAATKPEAAAEIQMANKDRRNATFNQKLFSIFTNGTKRGTKNISDALGGCQHDRITFARVRL